MLCLSYWNSITVTVMYISRKVVFSYLNTIILVTQWKDLQWIGFFLAFIIRLCRLPTNISLLMLLVVSLVKLTRASIHWIVLAFSNCSLICGNTVRGHLLGSHSCGHWAVASERSKCPGHPTAGVSHAADLRSGHGHPEWDQRVSTHTSLSLLSSGTKHSGTKL